MEHSFDLGNDHLNLLKNKNELSSGNLYFLHSEYLELDLEILGHYLMIANHLHLLSLLQVVFFKNFVSFNIHIPCV
jgi:hypothetical protein